MELLGSFLQWLSVFTEALFFGLFLHIIYQQFSCFGLMCVCVCVYV